MYDYKLFSLTPQAGTISYQLPFDPDQSRITYKRLSRADVNFVANAALYLLDRRPKCEETLNAVLVKLGQNTGVPPKPATIRQLIAAFNKEGNIYPKPDGGVSTGYGGIGDEPQIYLSYSVDVGATAGRFLFELLHIAGGLNYKAHEGYGFYHGYYNDFAIYDVFVEMGLSMTVEDFRESEAYKRYGQNWGNFDKTRLLWPVIADVCLGVPSQTRPAK
jgi:hypothetical protein